MIRFDAFRLASTGLSDSQRWALFGLGSPPSPSLRTGVVRWLDQIQAATPKRIYMARGTYVRPRPDRLFGIRIRLQLSAQARLFISDRAAGAYQITSSRLINPSVASICLFAGRQTRVVREGKGIETSVLRESVTVRLADSDSPQGHPAGPYNKPPQERTDTIISHQFWFSIDRF